MADHELPPPTTIFCKVCAQEIVIPLELLTLIDGLPLNKSCFLHGHPLHAMIIFSDSHGTIRGTELSESLQFTRDATMLNQIIAAFHRNAENNQ